MRTFFSFLRSSRQYVRRGEKATEKEVDPPRCEADGTKWRKVLEAGSVSSDPSQSQRLCLAWTPLTGTDSRGGLPAPEDGRASVLFGGNFGAVGTDLKPAGHPSLASLSPASNAVSAATLLKTCGAGGGGHCRQEG